MADDFSDEEEENIDDQLISTFNSAANFLPQIVSTLESSTLLELYALYKQANAGNCDTPKPSWFRTQERAKWEAWVSLKDMPKMVAMQKYISKISEIDRSWLPENNSNTKERNQGWVAVSTLTSIDEDKCDSDKTIIDYCKDGNIDKVTSLLENTERNLLDNDGLGLIHWAADRGYLKIIELLLTNGCDINLKDTDGQTALHYAVSCGHKDCVNFLLEHGADIQVQDDDGMLAVDLSDDVEIKQYFYRNVK